MVVHPELLASVWGEGLPGPLVRLGWARPSYVRGGSVEAPRSLRR